MFDKWLKLPAHYYLHLTGLLILVVGVSVSNVLMSIGSIWLISNWVLEGRFNEKLSRLKSTPVLWAVIGLYGFSFITLLWSQDLDYGIHDLRVKLPFLTIPLVLGTTKPIEKAHFYGLIYAFIATLVITSVYNYLYYIINQSGDIRVMSSFISHVRYSVLINFGIFFGYYIFLKQKKLRIWITITALWLLFYLYKSQTITGYGIFAVLFTLSVTYWILQFKNKRLKHGILAGIGIGVISLFSSILYLLFWSPPETQTVSFSTLDLYTVNDNGYYHVKDSKITEDGKLVYIYICEKECHPAWEQRSELDFKGLDRKGQSIEGTLYRYMTSKDLRKDSVGFLSLTDQDIINIENGYPNYRINAGIIEKLSDLRMQIFTFRDQGDPNGHSLIQRQIHLKTGLNILSKHWSFGVGVGDVKSIFDQQYVIDQTKLLPENRHRAHNQFLTIWISHGLIGFIALIFIFIYPLSKNFRVCDYLLCVVLITFGVSFLWQDMLETQAGVTIFSLFYSLVVFKPQLNGKN